jgi:valyl-tRNA synthetase
MQNPTPAKCPKKEAKKKARELKKKEKMRKLAEKAAKKATQSAKSAPKKKAPKAKDEDTIVNYPSSLNEIIEFRRDYKKNFLPQYNPYHVEQHWYDWWCEKDFFHSDPKEVLSQEKSKYVIILPPPNVTGSLHLGHALTSAIQDCLIRWKKMKGFCTVYLPGLDHAGIATQSVVERTLDKEGISKYDLGREEFLKKVWEWKETYGNKINTQMRRLGTALDWKRASFTMDEVRSQGVKKAFVELHRRGLIYRANRLVNWSCKLKTAISNIETESWEVTKPVKKNIVGHDGYYEFGVLIDFAYKVKGDESKEIVVSTTRIETMLGDTAVAVHSKDERYKDLVGKELVHPFIPNRSLKVITDDELVDMELGTGAVKVTPAHDHNDFRCGQRNNLEFINILNPDGTLNENGGKYQGMKRYDVRKQILTDLEEMGLYRGKNPKVMTLSTCHRSGDIVEPILIPQWYVDTKDVSKEMIEVVEKGDLEIFPPSNKAIWNNFMNNQEDWCISRQLWWGHRIPAFKIKLKSGEYVMDPKKPDDILWFVEESREEAEKAIAEFMKDKEGEIDSIEQDEDVLDTWFSSAMLPFTNFGWPEEESEEFKAFFPNSVLETGMDILFFWVARMVMMSLFFHKKLPFKNVLLHSMVRDEEGAKMSKSKGNVIDPLEIIDSCTLEDIISKIQNSVLPEKEKKRTIKQKTKNYPEGFPRCGADALRFGLLTYMHENKDILLNPNVIISQRNFCNKIWNSYKFTYSFLEEGFQYDFSSVDVANLDEVDQWILSKLNTMVRKVNHAFESFDFGNATEFFQTFWIHYFCDFYLESTKVVDKTKGNSSYAQKQQVIFHVLIQSLRVLHPMMPFLTEELFQKLPGFNGKSESICLEQYPRESDQLNNPDAESKFESVLTFVKEVRALLGPLNLPSKHKPKLFLTFIKEDKELGDLLMKYQDFIIMMTKTESMEFMLLEKLPKECLETVVFVKLKVNAFVKGFLNIDKEIKKTEKKINQTKKNLEKLDRKMEMPDYQEKTPEDIRLKEETKAQNYKSELVVLEGIIQKFMAMKS